MQLATAMARDRRSSPAANLDDLHRLTGTPAVPHAGRLAVLVVATIVIGLAVDSVGGFPGQIVTSMAVWSILTCLLLTLPRPLATRLVACTWISGLGEMVASLAWGLYDYQFGNVPLFVPPGHALLYLLGLIIAQHLPARAALAVPLVAAPLVAWLALSGLDTLSLPLFAVFCIFMAAGRHKRLYATMFVIALLLELYGTALGNWSWRSVAPGIGLATLNPPLAAGVFYCALDWLVHCRMSGLRGRGARAPC